MPGLRERVKAASAAPPLNDLAAGQRQELERELALAESLEDLPGKWQAAVLESEGHSTGSSRSSRCCNMRAVAPHTRWPPTV